MTGPATASGLLPRPTRTRWTPLRAGVHNVWQFDEVFQFEDGRLLLRGENGSGKSMALGVLLPFLLDGSRQARHIDPFGSEAGRRLEDVLLERGVHTSRLGYVWLELGRRDPETGGDLYLTLGSALQARSPGTGVDGWYFLCSRRVGEGLSLIGEMGALASQKQLTAQLADDPEGEVVTGPREYAAAVDRRLFGLGDRFERLVATLRQLRKPQLSAKLSPDDLSDHLTDGLRSLDDALVTEVADGFDRLHRDQETLAEAARAAEAVRSFLVDYRRYAERTTRHRAAAVRATDSRMQEASGRLRRAEADLAAAREREASARRERESAAVALAGADERVRTLEASPAMRSARELAETEGRATREGAEARAAEVRSEALEQRCREREIEAEAQGSAAARAVEVAAAALSAAATSAAPARLDEVHERVAGRLPDHEGARAVLDRSLARRRDAIGAVLDLARTARQAEMERRAAADRAGEADEMSQRAAAALAAEGDRLDRAIAAAADELAGWLEALTELRCDPSERDVILAAPPSDDPAGALARAVTGVHGRCGSALREQRMRAVAAGDALRAELVELGGQRDTIVAERDEGPPHAAWRDPRPQGRAGAPLWRACDFAPDLDARSRAALEAALEASGLLEAWVTPEGALLDDGLADSQLLPVAGGAAGRTLADVLVPCGDAVPPGALGRLLAGIALDEVPGDGGASLRLDGGFRLGPLAGRAHKQDAEHVGAAARDARRRRRLEELDTHIAQRRVVLEAADGERAHLDGRLRVLDAERDGAPACAHLAAARGEVRVAERRAADAERELDRRRTELQTASQAAAEAVRRVEERAVEVGLRGAGHDVDELLRLRSATDAYAAAAGDALHRAGTVAEARRAAESARERLDEARDDAGGQRAIASAARRRAEATAARAQALRETQGVAADTVLALHAQAQADLTAARTRRDQAEEGVTTTAIEAARAEGELSSRGAEHGAASEERTVAITAFRRLAGAGLLRLARPDVDASGDPPQWSLTRCLDLARTVDLGAPARGAEDDAHDRSARNRIHQRQQDLARELPGHRPRLDEDDTGHLVVTAVHGGRLIPVEELGALLDTDVAERRANLTDEERDLFQRFLLGEVGDQLSTRILEAEDLVRRMNGLLATHPTASGMTLSLEWRADPDIDPATAEAVRLLRRRPALLPTDERDVLARFLQRRVEEARRDDVGPWREHLDRALDYRHWHRFTVWGIVEGRRERVTQRSHAAGSGGEKAVTLHLPLFAAAAAAYDGAMPHSPRLVMLDEAFAGIDIGMRGRCMRILVELRLDCVLTSHEEWGTYAECPGIAVYNLSRVSGIRGVFAERFVWNGTELISPVDGGA